MLAGIDDLLAVVTSVYGSADLPREFRVLRAARAVQGGQEAAALARGAGTTAARLRGLSKSEDPIRDIFHATLDEAAQEAPLTKAKRSLGQMLLGSLAERAFERFYKKTLGDEELHLEDARKARTETDYRVVNGRGVPVFRLNIKFHGTLFDRAREVVGLEPNDCFALATYKINQGIKKQEAERLPYVFAIVSVPGLTRDLVGAAIPTKLINLSSFVYASTMSGKRNVEDAVVQHLIASPDAEVRRAVDRFAAQIEGAEWRVISARRAHRLLRDLLFVRVPAITMPRFTRAYGRAEVDMHFSISKDLTPLEDFLRLRKEHGLHGLAVRLEAGDV